jgi:hypothetical protein
MSQLNCLVFYSLSLSLSNTISGFTVMIQLKGYLQSQSKKNYFTSFSFAPKTYCFA